MGTPRLVEPAACHRGRRNPQKLPANRASNFSCAPATPKIPARNGRAGSVHTRNPAAPSKPRQRGSAQWKAVIHDGRPGDGIEWVSLAYLPRNVAPVIDGIALQDPGVRAQGVTIDLSPANLRRVTLKMPPTPNHSPVWSSRRPPRRQNSSSRRKDSRKEAINPFCGAPTTITTTTCATAVFYRGENETRVETAEGQTRPEILFLGRHFPARWRLLSQNRRNRRPVESPRRHAEHRRATASAS